jgi:hypothetical protein
VQYTGAVGIPEITVSPRPRITDAASLYTLGVAYTIDPEAIERFLAANWSTISSLFTVHGPWEGYNVTRREPIRFQTTAHTLSLVLGLLGTGPANMKRYVDHAGLGERLSEHLRPGVAADLLAAESNVFAWANKDGQVRSGREGESFRVEGDAIRLLGIAFVPRTSAPLNLSGGHLRIRYRTRGAIDAVVIQLKPAGVAADSGLITKEIATRFADTAGRDEEIVIPLPATLGLSRIKEVVISHEQPTASPKVDLTLTRFDFAPTRATVGQPVSR